jgi:DNA primase
MKEHIISLLGKYLPGQLKQRGKWVVCKCPFHKDGQEAHPSFGVNIEDGGFNCYSCHEKGDIARLLSLLGASRQTIDEELKDIAEELKQVKESNEIKSKHYFSGLDPFRTIRPIPEVILGVYQWAPTALLDKGFNQKLLEEMEIGYDKINERVTYPLRDAYGTLAGISGGAVRKDQFPKYKVYQGGKTVGTRWVTGDFGEWFDKEHPNYTLMNHTMLWNYHNVFDRLMGLSRKEPIYLVEGFKACLWMIQSGFENTVACMGSSLSEHQQRLLHRFTTIVLCFDNDDAGRKATVKSGKLLWEPFYGRIKVLQYPLDHNNTQPDDYPPEQLQQMVQQAKQYVRPADPPRRQQKYLLGDP